MGGRTTPPAPPPSLECSAVLIGPDDAASSPMSLTSSASAAPSSSPEFDPNDADRDFSDVSSLRSYELNSDDDDTLLDAGANEGALRASAWLEVGSGRESQHARTDTTGSSGWSSRSSVSSSSASAVTDGDGLSNSTTIAPPPPSLASVAADGRIAHENGDSLSGSYADLEPSLHSDQSLSETTASHATAADGRSVSSASTAGSPSRSPVDGHYALDFPDPANVSSSFSSSLSSPPARPTAAKHAFQPSGSRSGRSSAGATAALSDDAADRARGAGLTFGTSGANSFVSDATWGSFDTPTASVLASQAALPARAGLPTAVAVDASPENKAAPAPTVGAQAATPIGLPTSIRVILLGAVPSPAVRARLLTKLLSLLAETTPPDCGLVWVRDNDVATAKQTPASLRDVHRPETLAGPPVVKGGVARAVIDIDDLTRIASNNAADGSETDIDRYIRSLSSIAPSSILVVHLRDAAVAPAATASAALSIGFLRFTLASSPAHLARVLPVDITAGGGSGLQTIAVDELERLRGLEGCVSAWGGILQLAKAQEVAPKTSGESALWTIVKLAVVGMVIGWAHSVPPNRCPNQAGRASSKAVAPLLSGVTLASVASSMSAHLPAADADVVQADPAADAQATTTPVADEFVPVAAEPLTSAVAPSISVAESAVAGAPPAAAVPSKGCGFNVGFPRFPSYCCSSLLAADAAPTPSAASASAPDVAASSSAPSHASLRASAPDAALASSTASTSSLSNFSLPTFEPDLGQVLEAASVFVGEAFELLSARAVVAAHNARALAHSLAEGAMIAYQSLAPSVLRALELAQAMRERAERVWKKVDTELWLAKRGASRLARTLRAVVERNQSASWSSSPAAEGKTKPAVPKEYKNATSFSHQFLHEVREVVHVKLVDSALLARGARAVADGRALSTDTLRDARRGLDRLVQKGEAMHRELLERVAAQATKQAPAGQ